MNIRDKQERAKFERQYREEQERPLREAVQRLTAAQQENAGLQREIRLRDLPKPDPTLDESAVRMEWEQDQDEEGISLASRMAALLFMEQCPESRLYFPNLENSGKMIDFMLANSLDPTEVGNYEHAFRKLLEYDLLTPLPEPIASAIQEQTLQPVVQPVADTETEGINPADGRPRSYTQAEINRMTADQFAQAFRLARLPRRLA